ncbi:MAG: FAD-dependent oxidoreductase, partial [Nitriliruptoraceae bacterium]
MQLESYDVIVLGSGAAGVPAAIAAAESGASVALIERGPIPGGELIGGLPILGAANGDGQWIVRGVLERLLGRLDALGGYVGLFFDWRTMWGACIDPEMMKLVVIDELVAAGVTMRLSTQAIDVVTDADGHVESIVVTDGNHQRMLRAATFVDASGDGWLASRAGAEMVIGDGAGDLQPVSLTFRLSGVDIPKLLGFVATHPEELIVSENPIITEDPAAAARRIAEGGQPFFSLSGEQGTTMLGRAIERGEMFPTTAYYTWPTSTKRREVGLNVTRLTGVDGADARSVSAA